MSGHSTKAHKAQEENKALEAAPPAPPVTVAIEIAGVTVNLPLKFAAGHVLTDKQAKILDAAYQRQFRNNQEANAKARADRFSKATTDAERSANRPLTGAEVTALYGDYEPTVGGSGSGASAAEKLKTDVAWRFWISLVAEHNKAVTSGAAPVIAKAGMKQVKIAEPPRKQKGQTDEAAKAAREAFDAERSVFIEKLYASKDYGPKIAALLEIEKAARAASVVKTDAADVVVADGDLLS